MPGFLTDDEAKTRLADVLKLKGGAAELQGWWQSIVADANARAYEEITSLLIGRGYTLAQINAWDYGAGFQADLMLYFALSRAATTDHHDSAVGKQFIDSLDRRGELSGQRGGMGGRGGMRGGMGGRGGMGMGGMGTRPVQLIIGGKVVEPGDASQSPYGAVGFGAMSNPTDRWSMDTPT